MLSRSPSRRSGFTMIELLMVIMLTSVLSATAVTQYLDFKKEGQIASSVQYINNLKSSLKMALQKARIHCAQESYPSLDAIVQNSLYADGYCTTDQLTDIEDTKILTNSVAAPINPLTNLNTIVSVNCSSICTCNDVTAGYYYNQNTGDIGYPNIGDCAPHQ